MFADAAKTGNGNNCCRLPVEGNGHQREYTGCHSDVGDEIVDCAVEATERPVTE